MNKLWLWWKYVGADKLCLWVARRLPRRLAMWCAIRVGAHATQGKWDGQVVPDLLFMDALKRWDDTTPDPRDGSDDADMRYDGQR